MDKANGKIYIVATPIGNLSDMTFRAVETLKSVGLIAAEDTRRTRELLNHFNIKTKTTSFNEHTDIDKALHLIEETKKGLDIAIVSDAGTPIISDPGFKLTSLAIKEGIELVAVPGACAAINALVLSGLNAREFVFVGFIPEEKKYRKNLLDNLANEARTMIFYVSMHNLKKDLTSLIDIFGKERKASLSREMTKKYEETIRGSLSYIYDYYSENIAKGEFVLVLDGIGENILKERDIEDWLSISIDEHIKIYTDIGDDPMTAMKKVAKDRGLKKSDVYKMLKVKD